MMLNENPNITDVFSEGCTGVRVQISSSFLASQGLTYLPCARLQVYNLTSVHHCQAKPLRIRQRVLADWIWLPFPHRKVQYLNKMLRMQTLCQATSMISMMSMDVIGLCLQRHPEPAIGSPGISQRSRNEKTPRRICWSIEAVFQREAMFFFVTMKRSEPCGKLHGLHALPGITSQMRECGCNTCTSSRCFYRFYK